MLGFVVFKRIAFLSLLVVAAGIGAALASPAEDALPRPDPARDQTPNPALEPSGAPLCELVFDAASIAEQRRIAAAYARRLNGQCALLVRASEDARGAAVATPGLSVNGDVMSPVALDDLQWRQTFQQALVDIRAASRWHLDLYLAKTSTRGGSPSIDFSVCNLERERRFDGSFRLLLVERQPVSAQPDHYWRLLREIVRAPIEDLAPAAIVGCPLPERFELPISGTGLPLLIIAIVDDSAGRVQALLSIPMNRDGSQP